MKTFVCLLLLVVAATIWTIQKISAAHLAVQIEAHRTAPRELLDLQRDRERLRSLQPTAAELAALRLAAVEQGRLQAELVAEEKKHAAPPRLLPVGEWTPSGEWKNRGQASPRAALETALWAAAGGDVGVVKNLLSLAEPTREKARALLASLPAAARQRYASAEDLIAEFTIKNIPLGEAQLVWFKQRTDDDATAGLFLQTPPQPGEIVPPPPPAPSVGRATTREEAVRIALQLKAERDARAAREPPQVPAKTGSSATYLSLHREAGGWRLVVPPSAVDEIARELASAVSR